MNTWPAPAKLNLFLHVTGQRADGYHELSTAFQFINLCDRLTFSPREDEEIRLLDAIPGVRTEDNLIVRAIQALRKSAALARGVEIRLDKRIPRGAGLGGGSSDAATTLVALNAIWELGLTPRVLMDLGLVLGADVPVFIGGLAAYAEGVGERLIPMDFPELWYAVINPGVAVSTEVIFRAPELTHDSLPVKICNSPFDGTRNDCEPVVVRRYPEVAKALEWLRARGEGRLTGTGGCVFTWRTSRRQVVDLAASVPPPWSVQVARGCNRSPLISRLAE